MKDQQECEHNEVDFDRGVCAECGAKCRWHYEKEWEDSGHDMDGNCVGHYIETPVVDEWEINY